MNFWVTTFNVGFGFDPEHPEPVSPSRFFDLDLKDGGSGGNMFAEGANSGKEAATPHVFSCQAGLVPKGQGETLKDAPWVVRGAGFAFNVACKFAIASCTVVTAATKDEKASDKNSLTRTYKEEMIYAKPMRISAPMKSDLEVKIYRDNTKPTISATATAGDEQDRWNNVQSVLRPMPSGLWGKYDEKTDPSRKDADKPAMLSTGDGIKQLMAGVDLHAPDAKLSREDAIQFNVADAMGQDVFDAEPKPEFVHFDGADSSWDPVTPSGGWRKDKDSITNGWVLQAEMAAGVLEAWTNVELLNLWDLK